MTQNYGGYTSPPAGETGLSGSSTTERTTERAREEARGVGESVKEAGGHVGQTAADQVKEVTSETRQQARDLMYEGRQQVREQARTGQYRAAEGLTAMADELRNMASSSGQSGMVTEMARQAADRVYDFAAWLQKREPSDLLEELRRWARQHPGMFLFGAALAGVVAGRLTSGVVAHQREVQEAGPISTDMTVPEMQPLASDYPATTAGAVTTGTTGMAGTVPPATSAVQPPYGDVPPAEPSTYPPGPSTSSYSESEPYTSGSESYRTESDREQEQSGSTYSSGRQVTP